MKSYQELTNQEMSAIIDNYNIIKKQIRTLANNKSNYSKTHEITDEYNKQYQEKLKEMQELYKQFEIPYKCNECDNIFNLRLDQFKKLLKEPNYPLCCSRQCATRYKDKQYYNNTTEEELKTRNSKISNTIKQKINEDEEYRNKLKEAGKVNLTNYWKEKDAEERSNINKKSAIVTKQTKLERYGDANYNNKEQISITYKKNNTPNNPAHNWEHIGEENLKIIRDRELFKNFILTIPLEERCIISISEKLNISRSYCSTLLNQYDLYKELKIHRNLSKPQMEIQDLVNELYTGEIIVNTKRIIPPYELDIYIPEKQIAIEYNGNYYHTTANVDKKAHYNKSVLCEEKGIRLIHIFEYEWDNPRQQPILENIIKSALGITKTVYARKLKIEERSSASMKEFFETNNIQGFRGGKTAICLVDDATNEVYMSYIMGNAFFGKGKYQWEVIRGATKLGYTVVGGASKIWKYFIETYKPKNCVYYVDYNYFNGKSLENLPKMEFIETQFSFKNYWVKERKVKNREPFRHKEIKELEVQGLVYPIYNAGTKVYVWQNKD